jgi:drug/metabolite transporter (DMT)-like permease
MSHGVHSRVPCPTPVVVVQPTMEVATSGATRLYASLLASLLVSIILYNLTSNDTNITITKAYNPTDRFHLPPQLPHQLPSNDPSAYTFDSFFLILMRFLLLTTVVVNVAYVVAFSQQSLASRSLCLSSSRWPARSRCYQSASPGDSTTTTTVPSTNGPRRGYALEDDFHLLTDETLRSVELDRRERQDYSMQRVALRTGVVASETPASSGLLDPPSLTLGRALVLAAAAIYGTNFAAVKLLDEAMPMALSAALRFSLAAVVVTSIVLANERKTNNPQTRETRWGATLAGAEVGAWYCIGYICQASGLHTSDASKSAFFNALAVIVVPLLDSFFKGKKLGGRGLASVAMAIGGVALLQMGPALTGTSVGTSPADFPVSAGDMFCLAQALFFGIGYWRLEAAATQFPHQASRITAGQLCAVAAGSVLLFVGADDLPTLQALEHWLTDGFIVKTIIWTGLFSTALALYLETVALKVVSATELTVLMTSVSLWGSAFAYVTMGEMLDRLGLLGGLLILTGCVLSSTGGSPNAIGNSKDFLNKDSDHAS